MAHGNRLSIATRAARRRHQDLDAEQSRPIKVMTRLDRIMRERGVRAYRGCSHWGRYFAKLRFDHGFIIIGPFGDLTWRQDNGR
jgi:hypothetical protein